ncbi:MAG: WD40 repeat domain-containing protein [Verrucomicrobiia bacterium]
MNLTKRIFDPANDRMAMVAEHKSWTQVFSTETGQPLTRILNHGADLNWVDFCPDGARLLTAGNNPEIRIWSMKEGEQTTAPLRLGNKPLGIALWSLDGRFIVSRSDDNLVRVWDGTTSEAVTPVLRHEGYVRYAILGQQNRLITVSLPNRLRIWDLQETKLPPDVLTDYARLVSGRRITASGGTMELSAVETAALCRDLQKRAPELFEFK